MIKNKHDKPFYFKMAENKLDNFKLICDKYEVEYTRMLRLLINFCISKEKETENVISYLKKEMGAL